MGICVEIGWGLVYNVVILIICHNDRPVFRVCRALGRMDNGPNSNSMHKCLSYDQGRRFAFGSDGRGGSL